MPLAWLNLWNDKARTVTALAGTMFAVVLVLMQFGFFRAVLLTAEILYSRLDFDVVLNAVEYEQVLVTGTFDQNRLFEAAAVPEVVDFTPVSIRLHLYRNPKTGMQRALLIVGVDPRKNFFRAATPAQTALLLRENYVLLDELSRPSFGPRYPGLTTEIGDVRVTVADLIRLGCGFGADGTVVTSNETFVNLLFPRSPEEVSLGLVRLRPGADVDDVVRRMRAILPADVVVSSRAEFLAREANFWAVKTSIGVIVGMGVIVSLLVGTMIVYQVLAADVARRLPEYAVMKAMGYTRRAVSSVVMLQAITIGVLGFVPGWLISKALYGVTERQANVVMEMGATLPAVAFVLSILMCCASGLAALRRLHAVDPADLFV